MMCGCTLTRKKYVNSNKERQGHKQRIQAEVASDCCYLEWVGAASGRLRRWPLRSGRARQPVAARRLRASAALSHQCLHHRPPGPGPAVPHHTWLILLPCLPPPHSRPVHDVRRQQEQYLSVPRCAPAGPDAAAAASWCWCLTRSRPYQVLGVLRQNAPRRQR